jgi:hypothetical protein
VLTMLMVALLILTPAAGFAVGPSSGTSRGSSSSSDHGAFYTYERKVVDILVRRPILFAVTAVGAGLFVVALPFTALAKSIPCSSEVLINEPGRETFTNPPGNW